MAAEPTRRRFGPCESARLREADGRTKRTVLVDHETQEGRDMHIASGMEAGLSDALDLLEGLIVAESS